MIFYLFLINLELKNFVYKFTNNIDYVYSNEGYYHIFTNKIYMLKTGSTVAIAKTINGDLAYISKQSMKAITFNSKGNTKFVFNVINPDDITVEELGRLIY